MQKKKSNKPVHFSPGAASRAHSVEVSRHNSEVYNKSIREVVLHSGVRVKGNRGIYNSPFITLILAGIRPIQLN